VSGHFGETPGGFRLVGLRSNLEKTVAKKNEFADKVHLLFEEVNVHVDGSFLGLFLFGLPDISSICWA
jgi:hypothetical protein